jgi:hypothetical protein
MVGSWHAPRIRHDVIGTPPIPTGKPQSRSQRAINCTKPNCRVRLALEGVNNRDDGRDRVGGQSYRGASHKRHPADRPRGRHRTKQGLYRVTHVEFSLSHGVTIVRRLTWRPATGGAESQRTFRTDRYLTSRRER